MTTYLLVRANARVGGENCGYPVDRRNESYAGRRTSQVALALVVSEFYIESWLRLQTELDD